MTGGKDAALLIVGHGSTVNPDSSSPTLAHAAEIRRREVFVDVECAFWKEEPSLRDARFFFQDGIDEVFVEAEPLVVGIKGIWHGCVPRGRVGNPGTRWLTARTWRSDSRRKLFGGQLLAPTQGDRSPELNSVAVPQEVNSSGTSNTTNV